MCYCVGVNWIWYPFIYIKFLKWIGIPNFSFSYKKRWELLKIGKLEMYGFWRRIHQVIALHISFHHTCMSHIDNFLIALNFHHQSCFVKLSFNALWLCITKYRIESVSYFLNVFAFKIEFFIEMLPVNFGSILVQYQLE